jgi:hypothetical protein
MYMMKTNPFACLLLAAAMRSHAAPTGKQIVLNATDEMQAGTVTTTTSLTAATTVYITATATSTTHASVSSPSVPPKHNLPALWDWLFHLHTPNEPMDLDALGCFCSGGALCCFDVDNELECGMGAGCS